MNNSQIIGMKNGQINKLARENERLKTLLYNALVLLNDWEGYPLPQIMRELGMTEQEYSKLIHLFED